MLPVGLESLGALYPLFEEYTLNDGAVLFKVYSLGSGLSQSLLEFGFLDISEAAVGYPEGDRLGRIRELYLVWDTS